MHRGIYAAIAAAAGITTAANAQVVLGSYDFHAGFGTITTDQDLRMGIGVIVDGIPFSPANRLFPIDETVIGAADVGTTWIADGDTGAAIRAQFADDDLDDAIGYLYYGDTSTSGSNIREAEFAGLGLDLDLLATYTEALHVTLLSWESQTPGLDPNDDGNWTDFQLVFRFEFVSSIPAPGTGALLTAGALLPARRAR